MLGMSGWVSLGLSAVALGSSAAPATAAQVDVITPAYAAPAMDPWYGYKLRLAQLARVSGCGGIVTSAKEAREVRHELGVGFAIVTPGVRPAGSDVGDQARVATPAEAIAAGATHIVVGRPITAAANPAAAAQAIVEEMAGVTVAA